MKLTEHCRVQKVVTHYLCLASEEYIVLRITKLGEY